ncbi:hypothetical protein U9M48_011994 [Paspalum notatum var. saurae]|uniref:Disease resistance protein n=1 Tax=Paspalum notatum var. saurae TaxID=547442 RepID=A0AAQ3SX58_PASNO
MKSLLGKLGSLLAQEYTLIRGVRGDIQYINDELASMQAFLGDLGSTMDDHDLRLKHWMKQIRDMAYDMEDCIDDFAHRLPHDSSLSDTRCSFIVTWFYELWTFQPRRDIASKIAELKVRAQQIAERRSRYGVENPSQRSGVGATRAVTDGIAEHQMATRQLIHTQEPVVVDEEMQKLRNWLKESDKGSRPAVLSIVGFGGVGKTTIATALYRDFRSEFNCRAMVTVSQNYDEDQVLRDILSQIKARDKKGQIDPQDSEHDEQDGGNTERLEKNRDAGIKGLVKGVVVPFLRGHRKDSGGSTHWTQNNVETMTTDQLKDELKQRLDGKRYL